MSAKSRIQEIRNNLDCLEGMLGPEQAPAFRPLAQRAVDDPPALPGLGHLGHRVKVLEDKILEIQMALPQIFGEVQKIAMQQKGSDE